MNIHSQTTIHRGADAYPPDVIRHDDGTVSIILYGDSGHVALAGHPTELLVLLADARKALLDDVTSRVVEAAAVGGDAVWEGTE